MAGRSVKTMLAYIPGLPGTVVPWETAGNYTHVGLVYNWQANEWGIVAKGWSPRSLARQTGTAARRMYAHAPQFASAASAVVPLYEATAPVIARYFGDHRVTITAIYGDNHGWQSVNWHAGRSFLRQLDREGVTAIAVGRPGHAADKRIADFQMTEVMKSLNSREARV